MSAEKFFLLLSAIAGAGWLGVIVLSRFWKHADRFVFGVVVMLIAVIYTFLNFGHINEVGGPSAFLNFEGVQKVFSNPYLIDAGWAHIMAFDLLVGIWIKNNAAKHQINYALVVVILLLTIMFAPLGLIIYVLVHWLKTKQFLFQID
jgi:hypothetical protein